jgi:hypothetical protein
MDLYQEWTGDNDNLIILFSIGGLVGTLPDEARHQISGNVYFVDSKTIFIEDFNYDATAPGSYNMNSQL